MQDANPVSSRKQRKAALVIEQSCHLAFVVPLLVNSGKATVAVDLQQGGDAELYCRKDRPSHGF